MHIYAYVCKNWARIGEAYRADAAVCHLYSTHLYSEMHYLKPRVDTLA